MTDVLRQTSRAICSVYKHLHERKRVSAIKRAPCRIEKFGALAEKRVKRHGLIRRRKRFNQVCAIASRSKRKYPVKQPIGWLDEYRAGSDMRFFSINHLQ